MITTSLYVYLANLLRTGGAGNNLFYIAVGAGRATWDRNPPLLSRDVTRLAKEVARKLVSAQDTRFIDENDAETEVPSMRLRLSTRFGTEVANETLREVGLFAQASGARDSGTLLSYFVHAPIQKAADMSLERSLRLDLTPRAVGGAQPTRYLGNSKSREVHDLENLKTACQIGEIRFDRRIFFGTAEQAVELSYDKCAFCFGRERSER